MRRFKLNIPVASISMALTVMLGLALVGCSDYTTVEPATAETPAPSSETTEPDPLEGAAQERKLWERTGTLYDGREVTCLAMDTTALSCDWGNATWPAPAPAPSEVPAPAPAPEVAPNAQ